VTKLRPRGDGGDAEPNIIDTLFGVDLEVELACKESAEEPKATRHEFHRKLVCNIEGGAGRTVQINHLHEGLMLGLTGDVEKQSAVLGRNAVWSRTARLAHLPRYLCIQMMRFYWKATPDSADHTGVKCKMLRPVTFPADNFDAYELCSTALKAKLSVWRAKYADAGNPAKRARLDDGAAVATPTAAALAPAPAAAAAAAATTTEDDDLAAALRMSMEGSAAASGGGSGSGGGGAAAAAAAAAASAEADDFVGYNLPPEFRGTYDLFALVTHKGRDADSGHYIGWVRKNQIDATAAPSEWLVFDDDSVSETDTEYVTSHLKGGGDDHMAYLMFYRAKA